MEPHAPPSVNSATVEVGETWRRLHPLSPVVRFGRVLIGVLVIAVPSIADSQGQHRNPGGFPVSLVVYLVLLGLGALGGVISWWVTRWRIAEGALQIETGLIRRQSLRIPLARIQAVDVIAPLAGRFLGLAEVAGALAVLVALKTLEREFGRRKRRRWGPRELDLDLLVFGRSRLAVERPEGARSLDAGTDPVKASKLLEIPHPEAPQRLFVLAPLADLAPGLVPPGWGATVDTLRRRREHVEAPESVRAVATWDGGRWRPIDRSG
jgi:2-amino-4-hydroxy-6-hydroxymethyldihydropteridine diphosphokinase